jgi:hypothetical protein
MSVKSGGLMSMLNAPEATGDKNFLEVIRSFKVKYDEEIEKIKKSADQRKAEGKSLECFHNGKLKKEIRGNYESYYICRCDADYVGDNCQISRQLYDSTQAKLMGYMDEIEKQFVNASQHHRKLFLTSLILINKFKVGRPIIERMVTIVEHYLQKDHELDNRKKLYVFYDAVILNLFDSLEDLRKVDFETFNTDSGIQSERSEVYILIHKVIEMLEASMEDHVYLNSFVAKHNSHYLGLDTYSFVLGEYRLKRLDKSKGFAVHNPNIDTSFNVVHSNRIHLNFEDSFDPTNSKHNLQMFALAAPLFDDKLKTYLDIPVSNFMYLKFVNPKKTHEPISNRDNKLLSLKIDFALTFIPAYDDILANVKCVAYYFGTDKDNVQGNPVAIDEDKMIITCDFPAYFEFRNYYFAVSMNK